VRRVDVAIVGGGVMGCATAWALARRGRSVVVFEQYEIGHARGSSHGSARIFRESYTDPQYVQMMRDALPLWRALEDEAGEQLLSVTGAINVGTLEPLVDAMAAAGSAFEVLPDASARFPDVAAVPAVFDPTAGVVHAERAWRAFAARAVAIGAEIIQNTRAQPRVMEDAVRIADVEAGTCVITAGAWVGDLVPDIAVHTTSETVSYFDVGGAHDLPVILDWSEPLVYAVPETEGWLYKLGRHHAGPAAHPDDARTPDRSVWKHDHQWLARHLPERAPSGVHQETCMYTTTADESFILERRGNVVIGSPCSGHAFKFAPLIGERIADLATSRD
jgi:sarcosine oxidase